jgi:hypothetical protein
MFSTGTFRYAIDHVITLSLSIKNCICYSSKKIMRDKAFWVGSLMYRIMFTSCCSCIHKSHQLLAVNLPNSQGWICGAGFPDVCDRLYFSSHYLGQPITNDFTKLGTGFPLAVRPWGCKCASHLSTKMNPSSLRFHQVLHHDLITWVHSRFNLKRFAASAQWQLMSCLCPLLNRSWRIHSRILVFDTVSHHTQSISPEG